MVAITPNALATIHAHARSAYPEECCGILLGHLGRQILDALPGQNLAPSNRATRYTLDPRAILHAEKDARERGLEVIGFYHSHPDHNALPSGTDASLAWDTYLYLILPVTAAEVGPANLWRFAEGRAEQIPLKTE
ncbi:MAG TPA: M67 family metallopeptidase [Phycisphaerae bacterium]|nr:M67 family metallopeptidase [Phycisphaerae bacterium]